MLAALRGPYRGRSSPVNAWWGTFDLAVSLFSGRPAEPPSHDFIMRNSADAQQVEVGWWPGDARYPNGRRSMGSPPRHRKASQGTSSPRRPALGADLGEYILDWDDVIASPDPSWPRFSSAGRLWSTLARCAVGSPCSQAAPKAYPHLFNRHL